MSWIDEDMANAFESHSSYIKEQMSVYLEEALNNKNSVAPSTIGVDAAFIEGFITEQMNLDFDLIARDFLKNCYGKLEQFAQAGWYETCDTKSDSPEASIQKRILRLIYNGAKTGDEYCKALIKYLYRTYYRKEYGQLKRFSKISESEIAAFTYDDEEETIDTLGTARILGMCVFMGIELDESCSSLYIILNRTYKEYVEMHKEEQNYMTFDKEVFEESVHQVKAWMDENEGKSLRAATKVFGRDLQFATDCVMSEGYPSRFIKNLLSMDAMLELQLVKALTLLKMKHPNREYSFEEIQHYAMIYTMTEMLISTSETYDLALENILGEEDPIEDEENPPLYEPGKVKVSEEPKTKTVAKIILNTAPVENAEAKKEDYLEEISRLRQKLNATEQQNSHLREMYAEAKQAKNIAETMLGKQESDREELIALRNFVFSTKQEEDAIPEENIQDMKAAIEKKNIVIIGGHVNWINKLKKTFPNWLFVLPENYKVVDGKMLEGKDRVYFYTDHIGHVSYGKFIAEVRTRKIPFGYIGSLNVDKMIEQIYNDMEG